MSHISSALLIQKGLLAFSLVVALVLLGILTRRLVIVQEETKKTRPSILLDLLSNMSESLDRIEIGLDDITARAAAAKTRLIMLNALRSQVRPCALFSDLKRVKKVKSKVLPT